MDWMIQFFIEVMCVLSSSRHTADATAMLFTPLLWIPLGNHPREGRQEPRRNASGYGAVPTSPKQKN